MTPLTPTTVEHGGTDAGPTPRFDLSTNANPFGPSPVATAALRADIGPYPDPAGSVAVAALSAHHGLDLATVVVGAGATELIDRLVRILARPVHTEWPTFGEYAGAAARHGLAVTAHDDLVEGLAALDRPGVAFVAHPGNPDGRLRTPQWWARVAEAAARSGTVVVADLAYLPMAASSAARPGTPPTAADVQLHAPNKAHGCTGLRAGWCVGPAPLAERLRTAAVSWSVSTPGLAFLVGTATVDADDWVGATVTEVHAVRDGLAAALRDRGHEVVAPSAPFVLLRVGDRSQAAAARLRSDHGVKVRRTDSMGLPGWWRLGGLHPDDLPHVLAALDDVLPRRAERADPDEWSDGVDGRGVAVERSGTRRAPASPPTSHDEWSES